jgi:hypothetical protein
MGWGGSLGDWNGVAGSFIGNFVRLMMCIDDGKWGTVVVWGRIVVCPFARGGQML